MKRYISSSTSGFSDDPLLPLEHQIDLAVEEAWALMRSQRSKNPFLSSRAQAFAERLQDMQSKIRGVRTYLNTYSDSPDIE